VSFGIHEVKKKKDPPKPGAAKPAADAAKPEVDAPTPPPVAAAKDEPDKPDLVIWHHADSRLQSMQQVQERTDKNSSHLCLYWAAEKKFVRLADEKLKQVTLAPKEKFAIGTDVSPYELSGNLNGQRYSDLYVVDVKSGERKLALKKNRYYFGASPTGTHFLYYQDGHYFAYDMAAMAGKNLTEKVPTSFINSEDDHNIEKPPAFPLGWTADGGGVLLSDLWDVWNVPVNGKAINLTVNGKKDKVRYTSRYRLDPEEKGIDLAKPMYMRAYGEWTKKSGIGLVENAKPGVKMLTWDDASFASLMKAKTADTYLFTRETNQDYPEYYSAGATLANAAKISGGGDQQKAYVWSAGTKLVDYTSEKGDKLQGALFLPANYEAGKKYPTIVYIYEKLSQGMNTYGHLAANGFNKSLYTSNGYAVLMPDIKYKINDPGMSAVWCLTPAVKAAIATGVVDPDKVALHGHSWGGYQTAFMITQSNLFKAAIAGAPLTDLISMYSSIYWNTGTTNQPIFESSQGRFTSGYMDNPEPYIRNSPVFHAQNVKTPLMILHNDKDGAVDFTQGIEYYNTLRRLQKNVIMLQYKGENHGLVKPANRKDYSVRMLEFFDYHLKGKTPPKWIEEGVPHLKIKEHIDERVEELTKSEKKPAPTGGAQ
jgi:acetyl esterase/lipase